MWQLIMVSPTVGRSTLYAVFTSKEVLEHDKLNSYLKAEYGEYCTIEYLLSCCTAEFSLTGTARVDRLLAVDELQ